MVIYIQKRGKHINRCFQKGRKYKDNTNTPPAKPDDSNDSSSQNSKSNGNAKGDNIKWKREQLFVLQF